MLAKQPFHNRHPSPTAVPHSHNTNSQLKISKLINICSLWKMVNFGAPKPLPISITYHYTYACHVVSSKVYSNIQSFPLVLDLDLVLAFEIIEKYHRRLSRILPSTIIQLNFWPHPAFKSSN